ncbi:DUF2497 domain-containing protein [Bosea sp. TND4EK4]|uniref:PopZ family protein n=1 Tax=Bosea sp. TND4EK4 TaxID=1907408 RepID=UPI0009556E77|nr:DUF2497 domain-containing protein [Bosea sp. TND4EK4]SIQ47228.1 hypothetical protein SAMN05880592_103167 [Bosea sp. TND4EK4]
MNAQAKPNEPSMEEILASIRRIISDDEAKPEEAAPAAEPEPEPAAAAAAEPAPIDDDVLDLGTEAAFVAPPVMPEPEPAPQPQFESDVDFADPAPSPVVAMPAPPPPAPEPDPAPVFASNPQAIDMASLLSDQTSSAVTSAFGQLANTVLSNNARTLEDLVKDMLKPMLKGWLDDNLPGMVERLVRAEIERVARGGRG